MPARRGRSDDEVADDAEPLAVLDLDDPELGIRPEDRFAAIPPGPRLVPRRVHDESTRAPVLLLAALLALFVVGSWLGGIGSDEASRTAAGPLPVLDQITGATLLLVADERATVIEVGRDAGIPVDDRAARALVRTRSTRSRVVPSVTAGRAWIVSGTTGGVSTAREIDITDGSTTAEMQLEGTVAGATDAGLVVERPSDLLEVVGPDGVTVLTLAPSGRVLGAAADSVAIRPGECGGGECTVTVTDVATGTQRELPAELAAQGTEFGSLSPDGRLLAIARSDGVDTRGILVDVELGTVTTFRARGVRRDALGPAALAWSPDGAWLFLASAPGGLDAVATGDGTSYRVDAELPPLRAILNR
ncbi:MAG: hypothetical protein ACRDZV_01350 [Acidimicrobiia bacterium]